MRGFMPSRTAFQLIATAVAAIALISCREAESRQFDMTTLTTNDINFFASGHRINFARNTYRDIQRAYGDPRLLIRVTANELGEVKRAYFSGFTVDYYASSNKLRQIQIQEEGIYIAGKIQVGSTFDQVEATLKNGIKTEDGTGYIFVVMKETRESGIGYWIEFDAAARVSKIRIENVPFSI
jgi:hypothetical protein